MGHSTMNICVNGILEFAIVNLHFLLIFTIHFHFSFTRSGILYLPKEFRETRVSFNRKKKQHGNLKKKEIVGHECIVKKQERLEEQFTIVCISFSWNETFFCWKPIFVAHYRYICLIQKKYKKPLKKKKKKKKKKS